MASMKKTLTRTLVCRNCGSEDIRKDEAAGDWVCVACGVVAEAVIDEHSEWRSFADSTEDASRVGGPMTDITATDAFAAVISGTTPMARELGRANARVARNPQQRNLVAAFQLISTFCNRLHVESVANTAKKLFKEHEQKLRGRGEKAIIGACILVACRLGNATKSFREVIPVVDVPKRELSQCVAKLKLAMGQPVTFTHAYDLVPSICNKLRLPQPMLNLAVMVARKTFDLGIAINRQPSTVAAAIICMVNLISPSSRVVADVSREAQVAESTIQLTYRTDLYARREEIFPTPDRFPPGFSPTRTVAELRLTEL